MSPQGIGIRALRALHVHVPHPSARVDLEVRRHVAAAPRRRRRGSIDAAGDELRRYDFAGRRVGPRFARARNRE
jgi:hypothetical protein